MEFKQELEKYKQTIDKELEKHIIKEKCPEQKLNQSKAYSLISSAKRLRPILMLSVYKMLYSEEYTEIMPYAIAMEMIHNFSLIHDDLPEVDNDDIRHRKTYKS